ncbi:hypothetical protein [Nakamurella antarctica]|nr:hypothetical protein [Nakamurella antarctica]
MATDINVPVANRTPVAYFKKTVNITDAPSVMGFTLTTVADDGVVVYVNGTEVGRTRVSAGPITNATYANAAVNTTAANAAPIVINVPVDLLVSGANSISVSTHLNYKSTPNISFTMSASLIR